LNITASISCETRSAMQQSTEKITTMKVQCKEKDEDKEK
jgi:hypothetical protein